MGGDWTTSWSSGGARRHSIEYAQEIDDVLPILSRFATRCLMFFDDRGGPTESRRKRRSLRKRVHYNQSASLLFVCLSFFFLWFVTKSVALDHHRIPWSPPTVASRSATSQSKLLHPDMDMDRPSDDRTDPSIEDSGMSSDSEWSPMPGSS